MTDYKIKENMFNKDDLVFLEKRGFRFNYFDRTYIELYGFVYNNSSTKIIFNKNIIEQIFELLKQGFDKDSEEIKSLMYKKVSFEMYELDTLFIKTFRPNKKPKYLREAWSGYTLERSLLSVDELNETCKIAYVPTGDFSDWYPKITTIYTSKESVKAATLRYIDDNIESFKRVREEVENE